jgi:hypothetical protein
MNHSRIRAMIVTLMLNANEHRLSWLSMNASAIGTSQLEALETKFVNVELAT